MILVMKKEEEEEFDGKDGNECGDGLWRKWGLRSFL